MKQPFRRHDHFVSSSDNPRVTLELEVGANPIRGTIDRQDGSRLRFWGWLELIDELRRAAEARPEGQEPRDSVPTDTEEESQCS